MRGWKSKNLPGDRVCYVTKICWKIATTFKSWIKYKDYLLALPKYSVLSFGCHGPFRDKTYGLRVKTNKLSHGVNRDCHLTYL